MLIKHLSVFHGSASVRLEGHSLLPTTQQGGCVPTWATSRGDTNHWFLQNSLLDTGQGIRNKDGEENQGSSQLGMEGMGQDWLFLPMLSRWSLFLLESTSTVPTR